MNTPSLTRQQDTVSQGGTCGDVTATIAQPPSTDSERLSVVTGLTAGSLTKSRDPKARKS